METARISTLLNSSELTDVPDDSMKDDDAFSWISLCNPEVRNTWIDSVRLIRKIDRLSEKPDGADFQSFYNDWHRTMNAVATDKETQQLVKQILTYLESYSYVDPWDSYIQATNKYSNPNNNLTGLLEHEQMLRELTGSIFCCFPFLDTKQFGLATSFGALDQFYNNLRDLLEDSERGLCFFPNDILQKFCLTKDELINLCHFGDDRYQKLMDYWLTSYLPKLRNRAEPFAQISDLHPSWSIFTVSCLDRYKKIETTFYECRHDFRLFHRVYWGAL